MASSILGKRSGTGGDPGSIGDAFSVPVYNAPVEYPRWYQDQAKMQSIVADVNQFAGPKVYNEDQSIMFTTMLDHYIANPMQLPTDYLLYLRELNPEILEKWPLTETDVAEVIWSQFYSEREVIPLGTRGTISPFVTARIKTERTQLAYYSQGFVTDLARYKLPGGPEMFKMHSDRVYSNLIHSLLVCCVATLHYNNSFYSEPATRLPHVQLPTNPRAARVLKSKDWGMLNKREFGLEALAQIGDSILAFEQEALTSIVVTREVIDIIKSDTGRTRVDVSGRRALLNRSTLGNPLSINFLEVPLLDKHRHGSPESTLLRHIAATGSILFFRNDTLDMDPDKYLAVYREAEMASWKTDGYDRYSMRDGFQHLFEFVPADKCPMTLQGRDNLRYTQQKGGKSTPIDEYEKRNFCLPGQLNRALLRRFCQNAQKVFRTVRTKDSPFNRDRYHCVTRYDPTVHKSARTAETVRENQSVATGDMFPLLFTGELSESGGRTRHLRQVYQTASNTIFKGISDLEYQWFCDGMNWVDDTMKNAVDFDMSLLAGRPILTPLPVDKRGVADAAEPTVIIQPNKFGSIHTVSENGQAHISGMFTINDNIERGIPSNVTYSDRTKLVVPRFVSVYRRIMLNIMSSFTLKLSTNPALCPLYHDSAEMSPLMRSYIVAWYSIFQGMSNPLYIVRDPNLVNVPTKRNDAGVALPTLKSAGMKAMPDKFNGYAVDDFKIMLAAIGIPTITEKVGNFLKFCKNAQRLVSIGVITANSDADIKATIAKRATISKLTIVAETSSFIGLGVATLNFNSIYKHIASISNLAGCLQGVDSNETLTGALANLPVDEDYIPQQPHIIVLPLVSSSNSKTTGQVGLCTVLNSVAGVEKEEDRRPEHALLWSRYRHVMIPLVGDMSEVGHSHKGLTFGDSLFGYLPFVDPSLPLIPRTTHYFENIENYKGSLIPVLLSETGRQSNPLNHTLATGYPLTRRSRNYDSVQYALQYELSLYNEDSYWAFRKTIGKKYPHQLGHLIFYPVTGNPFNTETKMMPPTIFEKRWMTANKYELKEKISAHYALTMDITTPNLCELIDKNIAPPLNMMILRPWETQYMYDVPMLSYGAIGKLYYQVPQVMNSTDPTRKEIQTELFTQFGASIEQQKKVYIQERAAGGDDLGGKGNDWFITKVPISAMPASSDDESIASLRKFVGDGQAIGNKSNIAVLINPSTTIVTDLNICGYSDARSSIGYLHDCEEFGINEQDTPQWDGVCFSNYIYRFDKLKTDTAQFNLSEYSLDRVSINDRHNTDCHLTSMRFVDRHARLVTMEGCHPWGFQGRGCHSIETGRSRIGALV